MADADTGPGRFGWRFCAPLFVCAALNPINSSVIATAIVPIAAAVGCSVGRASVLISVLYLATAIGQPTAGALAEEFAAPGACDRRCRTANGWSGGRSGRQPA